MPEPRRYLSVCTGIAAETVAWHPLGWEPVGFAEVAGFPSAVLAHRYPGVVNHGDFTAIKPEPGSLDLLFGGTPCQSFSVAGLRGGMGDARGNLALEFLRLAGRARPKWVVWENVPGVLSSGGGRDFGSFLGGLALLGYGWAYRVLDAQYFGLAQRRKRVFVVGCLGDWRGAVAVLLERDGLSRNPPPRREAGAGIAGSLAPGAHPGGFNGQDAHSGMLIPEVAHTLCGPGFDAGDDGSGRGTPLIPGSCLSASGNEAGTLIETPSAVRRLTPLECERLMGLPENFTAVPYRGKPAADGLRYAAIGNSIAVPVLRWIGRRIDQVDSIMSAHSGGYHA